MKNSYFLIIMVSIISGKLYSQYLPIYILDGKQSSKYFFPLKYQTFEDSIGFGFGNLDPTNYRHIVFYDKKPITDSIEDWIYKRVKYCEIYNKKISESGQSFGNSKTFNDTIKFYYLKKIKGLQNGLRPLIYENDYARLFNRTDGILAHLVYFQTTEFSIYDSKTRFLNYRTESTFKRDAKKIFKNCPQLISKIKKGEYFPKNITNLMRLIDDYASFCKIKN